MGLPLGAFLTFLVELILTFFNKEVQFKNTKVKSSDDFRSESGECME